MKNWQRAALLIICLTSINTTWIGNNVIREDLIIELWWALLDYDGFESFRPRGHRVLAWGYCTDRQAATTGAPESRSLASVLLSVTTLGKDFKIWNSITQGLFAHRIWGKKYKQYFHLSLISAQFRKTQGMTWLKAWHTLVLETSFTLIAAKAQWLLVMHLEWLIPFDCHDILKDFI